ncbi:MAG: hypothetical protein Q9166_008174 [cf. Caloplaca sp. 2 TL-2023]
MIRAYAYQRKCEVDKVFIREGLLEAAAELAKVENLGSLKIKFPCICPLYDAKSRTIHVGFSESPNGGESLFHLIHDILGPLKSLRFRGPVTFIAAHPLVNEDNDIKGPWNQTHNTQCEHAACLAFVTRFNKLAKSFESSLPRTQLSTQQVIWLKLKHKALKQSYASEITNKLYHLWTLAEYNQDVFGWRGSSDSRDIQQREFNRYSKTVSDELKAVAKRERVRDAERWRRLTLVM